MDVGLKEDDSHDTKKHQRKHKVFVNPQAFTLKRSKMEYEKLMLFKNNPAPYLREKIANDKRRVANEIIDK